MFNMNFVFFGKNYKVGDMFIIVLLDVFNFGNKNLSGNFLLFIEVEWMFDVIMCEFMIIFLKDGI